MNLSHHDQSPRKFVLLENQIVGEISLSPAPNCKESKRSFRTLGRIGWNVEHGACCIWIETRHHGDSPRSMVTEPEVIDFQHYPLLPQQQAVIHFTESLRLNLMWYRDRWN